MVSGSDALPSLGNSFERPRRGAPTGQVVILECIPDRGSGDKPALHGHPHREFLRAKRDDALSVLPVRSRPMSHFQDLSAETDRTERRYATVKQAFPYREIWRRPLGSDNASDHRPDRHSQPKTEVCHGKQHVSR